MKHIALLAAAAALFAGTASADPVFGTWQTNKDDNGNYGHIKVAQCGGAICGTLVKSFDSAGQPLDTENVGRQLIWDMKNEGGGEYAGGKLYSPDRDKTYNGRLVLSGGSLDVKGCVLGVCLSGGKWARVN